MAELALGLSIVALVVAFLALAVARETARSGRFGPRPNELMGLIEPPAETSAYAPSTPGSVSPQVAALIAQRQKIAAIKQYRVETGAGLKVAKDAVEAFERGQR